MLKWAKLDGSNVDVESYKAICYSFEPLCAGKMMGYICHFLHLDQAVFFI